MKRIVIAGAGGMTGSQLAEQAEAAGWHVSAFARADLDITDSQAVDRAIRNAKPDVVVNAAGYTAVDEAERDQVAAMRVNGDGAANLALSAGEAGATIVQISTDYVFDGTSSRPYRPDDAVGPLSAYGESKLAGEGAVRATNVKHVIVRTSWVYGLTGRNFLRTMLRLAGRGDAIRVVDDQRGCPTSSVDLAAALLRVATVAADGRAKSGTYHFANSGVTTWYGFAKAIFEQAPGAPPQLQPILSADFPAAATRPAYSVLDTTTFASAFELRPRPWQDALKSLLASP